MFSRYSKTFCMRQMDFSLMRRYRCFGTITKTIWDRDA